MKNALLHGLLASVLLPFGAAAAQSTAIVNGGVGLTNTLANSYGIVSSPLSQVQGTQYAQMAAGGATNTREQCSWNLVEQQAAPPSNAAQSTQYVISPNCAVGIQAAIAAGLTVDIVAGFGPPYQPVAYITMPTAVPVGASTATASIYSTVNGYSLSNLQPFYGYVCQAAINDDGTPSVGLGSSCYQAATTKTSGPGSLIASSSTSGSNFTFTLTSMVSHQLAAETNVAISGCVLTVNGAAATCPAGTFPANATGMLATFNGAGAGGGVLNIPIRGVSADGSTATLVAGRVKTAGTFNGVLNRLYAINQVMYPSPIGTGPTEPSIVAYAAYTKFLANYLSNAYIAAYGTPSPGLIQGHIELWNEVPWTGDSWISRAFLYDAPSLTAIAAYSSTTAYHQGAVITENGNYYQSLMPDVNYVAQNTGNDPAATPSAWQSDGANPPPTVNPNNPANLLNYGMAGAVENLSGWPSNIDALWEGTWNSGYNTLLQTTATTQSGTNFMSASRPGIIKKSVFHPYQAAHSNAENGFGIQSCMQTNPNPFNCYYPGQDDSANFLHEISLELMNPTWGMTSIVTETNTEALTAATESRVGVFDLRQYLGFLLNGTSPVLFFQLYDGTLNTYNTFSFMTYSGGNGTGGTYTPLAPYTLMQNFMQRIAPISNPPAVIYAASSLPVLTTNSGSTYPVAYSNWVGARSGIVIGNSILTMVHQVSACQSSNQCWLGLTPPAASNVTFSIPPAMVVTSAIDSLTNQAVSFTTSGAIVSLAVSDDPVEITFDPVLRLRGFHYFGGVHLSGGMH